MISQSKTYPRIRSDKTRLCTSRILVVAGRPFRSSINMVNRMASDPATVNDYTSILNPTVRLLTAPRSSTDAEDPTKRLTKMVWSTIKIHRY